MMDSWGAGFYVLAVAAVATLRPGKLDWKRFANRDPFEQRGSAVARPIDF